MSILLQLQVDMTDDLIYPTYNIDFEYLSILFILDENLCEGNMIGLPVKKWLKVIARTNSTLT